jgi:hypothetical protein
VLSWRWSLPFIGLLLTIATGPPLFPRIRSRHYGKVAAGWSALTVAAIAFSFGAATALDAFLRAMLLDYMSFIALVLALRGGRRHPGHRQSARDADRQHRHASPRHRVILLPVFAIVGWVYFGWVWK